MKKLLTVLILLFLYSSTTAQNVVLDKKGDIIYVESEEGKNFEIRSPNDIIDKYEKFFSIGIRYLPTGTKVKLVNLENNKTIIAEVKNYRSGMSYRTYKKLKNKNHDKNMKVVVSVISLPEGTLKNRDNHKEELLERLKNIKKQCIQSEIKYREQLLEHNKSVKESIDLIKNLTKSVLTFEEKYKNFIELDIKLQDIERQLANHKTNRNLTLSDLNTYKKQYKSQISKTLKPKDTEYNLYKINKDFLLLNKGTSLIKEFPIKPKDESCLEYNRSEREIDKILKTN